MKHLNYRVRWDVIDAIKSYRKQFKVLDDYFNNIVKETAPIIEKLDSKVSFINIKAYVEQRKNVKELKAIYNKGIYDFKRISPSPIKYYDVNFLEIDTKESVVDELRKINKAYKRTYKRTGKYLDLIKNNILKFDKRFDKAKSSESKEL